MHELGGIDARVNAAEGFLWEKVEGGSLDSWDRMYQMTLRTAIRLLPRDHSASARTWRSIVDVGAAAVLAPATGMASYTASKAGVHGLTQSLSEELRARSVRVNAVLPTILDTPANRCDMPDADRSQWVKPESGARVIAFLPSEDAASVTGAAVPLSLG